MYIYLQIFKHDFLKRIIYKHRYLCLYVEVLVYECLKPWLTSLNHFLNEKENVLCKRKLSQKSCQDFWNS